MQKESDKKNEGERARKRVNECKLKDESVCQVCVCELTVRDGERESGDLTAAGGLLFVGVWRLCVSVLGWCCSGKEGTCIFAIKLLPMHSHRGA